MNGSSTTSSWNVYNWIKRYGNSIGNGAGCPIFLADRAAKLQTDLVNSRNSSLEMVSDFPTSLSRRKFPFEKTKIYSWISRSVGFDADCHEPHAVDELAEAPLSQMISPRIKKPISFMSWIINACRGMYGLRPRLAMLMQARPPGTSTR